jgi:hypothetical protein
MAIKEVKMYTIKCDRCGKVFESDDYSAWDEVNYAEQDAFDYYDWIPYNNGHYCPDCYDYNEEIDDFIIKSPIPYHVFQLKTALEYTRFFMDQSKGKAILLETDNEYILTMDVPKQHIPIEYIKNLIKSCKYNCIEYSQNKKFYNTLNIKILK